MDKMTSPLLVRALQRPLVFGDKEQIEALRLMAEKKDYDALPECDVCDGTGEVTIECEDCDGYGKDPDALTEHNKKYP